MTTLLMTEATNPLIPVLAMQHDLRERFLHALQDAMRMLVAPETSDRAKVATVLAIITEATDERAIQEWVDGGRPMPWLDSEDHQDFTARVVQALR